MSKEQLLVIAIAMCLCGSGTLQIFSWLSYREAMHKALDVPNCINPIPDRKRTVVGAL